MAKESEETRAINRATTEIAKLDVMNDYFLEKMGMTVEQMQLLQNWYPGITAPEIMYATEFQREYGLSIIKREIWLIKRGGYKEINGKKEWCETYEPMVGIDGSRAAARNNAKRLGLDYRPAQTGVEIKPYPVKVEGKWMLKDDLVGWAEIDFGTHKTRLEVCYSECVQKTKEGKATKFWDVMGVSMIQKVAEHRLNKKVYGLYLDTFESPEPSQMIEPNEGNSKIETGINGLKNMKAIVQGQQATEAETVPTKHDPVIPATDDNTPPFDVETGEIEMTEFEKELVRAGITTGDIEFFFKEVKNLDVRFDDVNTKDEHEAFRKNVITNENAQMSKLLNFKKSFTAKK